MKELGEALQIIGVLGVLSGFVSAITEHYWHRSFGVAGLIDRYVVPLPWWGTLVVGALGVLLLGLGVWIAGRAKRDREAQP